MMNKKLKKDICFIVDSVSYGQFFILHLVGKNIKNIRYAEFLTEVASQLKRSYEPKLLNLSVWMFDFQKLVQINTNFLIP